MFNGSQLNDNMIRQNTDVPYTTKDKKQVLEEQNTIVVSNKKGFIYRLKQLFKRENKSK